MTARRVRVSVCAVTNESDIAACVAGGVDAVGVLVGISHPAADEVTATEGARLLRSVPPYVARYVVTHLVDTDALVDVVDALPVDMLQVHGDASPDVVAALRAARPGLRLLKSVHVEDGHEAEWRPYADVVDAVILDSIDRATGRIGGTGLVHDWARSAALVRDCTIPVVLAGGLTPANVADAVATVGPWAVNVNSGVEVDGHKDAERVRAFVAAANAAGETVRGTARPPAGRGWR